jgi:hypothetical protein
MLEDHQYNASIINLRYLPLDPHRDSATLSTLEDDDVLDWCLDAGPRKTVATTTVH